MGNKFAKYESKPFWLLVRGTLLHQWQAGAHKTMPFPLRSTWLGPVDEALVDAVSRVSHDYRTVL